MTKTLVGWRMCIKLLELQWKRRLHWSCTEKGGHSSSQVKGRKPRLWRRRSHYWHTSITMGLLPNVGNLTGMKKLSMPMPVLCTVLQTSPALYMTTAPLAVQVGASTTRIKQTKQSSTSMGLVFPGKLLLRLNQSMWVSVMTACWKCLHGKMQN